MTPAEPSAKVGRDDLERALARVRDRCRDPVAGPWGPESMMWRISREKIALLAGGRAALLQLAHPYVGEAVAASSLAVHDPMARFHRTFVAVYGMVFGDLDHALRTARRVHKVHEGVTGALPGAGRWPAGHRYHANEPHALRWVLGTLVDGSVRAYELVLGPLSPTEREEFWRDARDLGLLMGLDGLPATWAAFARDFEDTLNSDALAVTPAAAEVGRRILASPDRVTAPVWATYRAITAAWMPERLHAPFGLRWGLREQALARAASASLAATYRHVPLRARCVPAWHEATWRLAGAGTRTDHLGRWVENAALALLLRQT